MFANAASAPGAPISISPKRQAASAESNRNGHDRAAKRRERNDEAGIAGFHSRRRDIGGGWKEQRIGVSGCRQKPVARGVERQRARRDRPDRRSMRPRAMASRKPALTSGWCSRLGCACATSYSMTVLCQPTISANDTGDVQTLDTNARTPPSAPGCNAQRVGDFRACGLRNRVIDKADRERRGRLPSGDAERAASARAPPRPHRSPDDRTRRPCRSSAQTEPARSSTRHRVLGLNAAMPQ